MALRTSSRADEAQAAAGHGIEQWGRFYTFTKEEAYRVAEKYPNYTWPGIPADEKNQVMRNVNGRLAAESIPEVGEDVIRWRMAQIMREMKRQYSEGIGQFKYHSHAQSSAQSRQPQPPRQWYDPVKDVYKSGVL